MTPLIHRTEVRRLPSARALKAVTLEEFVRQGWRIDQSVLLLDQVPLSQRHKALQMPWGAVMAKQLDALDGVAPLIRTPTDADAVSTGDIIEAVPGHETLRVLYRRGDVGNVLFATERCNSYCLMCSQPPRDVGDEWRVQQNLDLLDLIDPEEPSLGITGGEPTLLGEGLGTLINGCAEKLPHTDLQILTNGRGFAKPEWVERLRGIHHPKLQWNVPLYADVAPVHDYVVQARGAFVETLAGLHALGRAGMNIEIRVVLHKPTIPRLAGLAHFIYRNLSFVRHVALMGIEPIGFALANREALWIDPLDYRQELVEAVRYLDDRGMRTSIYNLPLCVLDQSLHRHAAKSISTWKNVYLPECLRCKAQSRCGGFFASHKKEWASRGINPITITTGD